MLKRTLLAAVTVFAASSGAFAQNGPAAFPQGGNQSYEGPEPMHLSSVQPQNPYAGSVPSGQPTSETLQLTLSDAVNRGLKQNLGPLLASGSLQSTQGDKWHQLANLLPNITSATSENVRQVDFATFGFRFSFPGFAIPTIVGPFGYFDTRAYLSQSLFNWEQITRSGPQTKT